MEPILLEIALRHMGKIRRWLVMVNMDCVRETVPEEVSDLLRQG